LTIGALVGVLATRSLGPERYGNLAYAVSIVSLSGAFIGLGLDQIVIRDLSITTKFKDELLGTAFLLKLISGMVAYVLSLAILVYINTEPIIYLLVSIIGLTLILRAFDVLDFWYKSQTKAKFPVLSRNIAFSIITILKIIFIFLKLNLIYFGALISLELFLGGIFLVYFYRRGSNLIFNWKFSLNTSKSMLSESWPLILGSMAASIYFNIDQILIGNILNKTQVGYYAAALRLSEIWYFIPSAIHISLLPTFTKIKSENEELFFKKFAQVCAYIFSFAIVFALVISLSAHKIINIIYGKAFAESGTILAIHVWTFVVLFIGVMASLYTMIYGFQKVSFIYNAIIALLNVLLDFYLIPILYAKGAAYATIIAYTIGNYFVLFFIPSTKKIAILITKTIINPFAYYKT
jgi:PST family polysaccharide transporter